MMMVVTIITMAMNIMFSMRMKKTMVLLIIKHKRRSIAKITCH